MYERTDMLVRRKFREHLLPAMLTTMAMSLAAVVDSMIVGQLLGVEALAVIGLSTPLIYCINIIYMIFGVGGMTCASIARGRRKLEHADRLFTVAFVVGMGVAVLFLILTQVLLLPICSLLAAGDMYMASMTADYLRPLLFTAPMLLFSSGLALFMRADGEPKKAANVVMIANAVNLVLDYVLIRFLNTGIMGAGLSTTLGYVVGAMTTLPYLLNRKKQRSFRFVPLRQIGACVWDVVRTGLPKGLTHIARFGRALVLNSIIMSVFGAVGMSTMTALNSVRMFANIFIGGTGETLLPIVGTLYGEGDLYGVRKTVAVTRNVLIIACAVMGTFFMLAPQAVAGIFALDTAQSLGVIIPALRMFVPYVLFFAAIVTLRNFYNTTGRVKLASAIALLDGFFLVCASALVLQSWKPDLLWLCFACGSGATLLFILVISVVVGKKEGTKGLLLIGREKNGEQILDISIQSTPEQAVGLSEKVIGFCLVGGQDELLANHIGISIEEMVMATIYYSHGDKSGTIDVMIRISGKNVLVRFRDNGKPFNPLEYIADKQDGLITDGIDMIKTIASSISYTRQLGFNTTVLTFNGRE